MTILTLQAMVTKTAVFDGAAVDVSGVPASQATLVVHIENLGADDTPAALLVVEQVEAADFSGGGTPIYVKHLSGAFTESNDVVDRTAWFRIPFANYDAATAKHRLRLLGLTGTNATITYEAWIEY